MDGEEPADFPEPPRLRQLRWLVNTLTATLIVGVIAIVTLLVIRLGPSPSPPLPELPPSVRLPAGESARAVTFGKGWVAVVTVDGSGQERIRVLDARTGAERAVTGIAPADPAATPGE